MCNDGDSLAGEGKLVIHDDDAGDRPSSQETLEGRRRQRLGDVGLAHRDAQIGRSRLQVRDELPHLHIEENEKDSCYKYSKNTLSSVLLLHQSLY